MKKNHYMLATAILTGGLIFASTGQAQQQPGKGEPGKGQAKPGQGKAGPGKGQRPGQGKTRPGRGQFQPGQGNRPQRGSGGFRGRNPFEGIGLSEEQQKKVDAIQKARTEESNKLRAEIGKAETNEARRALFPKFGELIEKYRKQTDAVLTDEQKKKMAEARAQRPQGGRGQGQPRPRGNSLASLNLTEEQQKKVTALQAKQRTERIELYRNAGRDREGLNEKIAALTEKHNKQIEALLTDEQKKKYKKLQAQRPQRRPGGGSTRPGGGRPRPEGKGKERPKRSDA
jgi:Spy/CpxP family protein refolding chaperone